MIFGFDKFYENNIPVSNAFAPDFKNNTPALTNELFGYEQSNCKVRDSELFALNHTNANMIDSTYNDNLHFECMSKIPVDVRLVDHIKEKYYYPLHLRDTNFWIKKEARYPNFSGHVISDLIYGKAKILISYYQEAMHHSYDAINIFNSWASNYRLPHKSIVIISGSHDFDCIFQFEKSSKHILFDYWEGVISDLSNPLENILLRKNILERKKRKKIFLCYNRRIKEHRVSIIYGLKQRNILNNGFVSCGPILFENDKSVVMKITNDDTQFLNSLPMTFDNRDLEENFAVDFVLKDYMESYFHIVTESWCQKKSIQNTFFSEKTFKPIVGMQPFFLVSNWHSLKQLKKLGYKTFSDWFDESYDECTDRKERISKILNEVEKLCKFSEEELQSMLIEMLPILEYNFRILKRNNIKNLKKLQKDLEDELWK